jgi:hypothetical protein
LTGVSNILTRIVADCLRFAWLKLIHSLRRSFLSFTSMQRGSSILHPDSTASHQSGSVPSFRPCIRSQLAPGLLLPNSSAQNQTQLPLPPPRKQNTACDACRCTLHPYSTCHSMSYHLISGRGRSSAIECQGKTRYVLPHRHPLELHPNLVIQCQVIYF